MQLQVKSCVGPDDHLGLDCRGSLSAVDVELPLDRLKWAVAALGLVVGARADDAHFKVVSYEPAYGLEFSTCPYIASRLFWRLADGTTQVSSFDVPMVPTVEPDLTVRCGGEQTLWVVPSPVPEGSEADVLLWIGQVYEDRVVESTNIYTYHIDRKGPGAGRGLRKR